MAPMTIALIADIHGNLAAFEAVLEALDRDQPDQVVCLGDVASLGPLPSEVLARLRELGCPVVMGNADAELLDPEAMTKAATDDAKKFAEITQWAAERLDDADRVFVASFRPTIEVPLGPDTVMLCCHGSPRSYDDIITATTPDEEIDAMMAETTSAVVAGGHTHVRLLRAFRGRELVNPGSVGIAYQFLPDGGVRVPAWAEYAILSSSAGGRVSVEFRRLAYDRDATVRAMIERGMPHAAWWSADWR